MNQKHYIYQQGGLGNQLFILAYADFLKRTKGINVLFYSANREKKDTKNKKKRNVYHQITEKLGFQFLDFNYFFFSLIKKFVKKGFFSKYAELHIEKEGQWGVFQSPKEKYIKKYNFHEGWYQSYLYQNQEFINKLRDIIYELVRFDKYQVTENDVAIHIRRGDFLHSRYSLTFNIIDVEYYLKGLEKISDKIIIDKVYILSDDFESIKDDISEISKKYKVILVEGNSVLEDLHFLTQFKNYVIGNSTFAWWGAYLSNKTEINCIVPQEPWKVVMPNKTPYPPNWERM